jgi:hypothetical protein
MPPVVPAHFPPVPRETESTSTSPRFRSGTGSKIIFYIHTPDGEFDVHSFDRTQDISGNKTSLRRPYNLSNMSKSSEESLELSSENISRMTQSTHPHLMNNEQQSPHNLQSKSHTYKKCMTHHTQTLKSIACGSPLMNPSPPEH